MLVVDISLSSKAPSFSLTETEAAFEGFYLEGIISSEHTERFRVVRMLGSFRFDSLHKDV